MTEPKTNQSMMQWGLKVGIGLAIPLLSLLMLWSQINSTAYPTIGELNAWGITGTVAIVLYWIFNIVFVLLGGVVGAIFFRNIAKRALAKRRRSGMIAGTIYSLPVIIYHIFTPSTQTYETLNVILVIVLQFILFMFWGMYLNRVYARLYMIFEESKKMPAEVELSRRRFLKRLGASVLFVTTLAGSGTAWLARQKAILEKQYVNNFPPTLRAKIFPGFQYPEQTMARYQPQNHPIGVCLSGGGMRAYSCALGLMKGLHALGLFDRIGAISGISGGAVMSTLFSYAPDSIPIETLLGPIVKPQDLTLSQLGTFDPQSLVAPIQNLTNVNIEKKTLVEEEKALLVKEEHPDKVHSRVLNDLVFAHYQLDDVNKFYTLNEQTLQDILSRNPELTANDFYIERTNHPFLIIGADQVYPIGGADQFLRYFELTAMYAGTPRTFMGHGVNGMDIGGGFVENIAVDSDQPHTTPDADGIVTIPTPVPPFLLSDMVGSSSAAPGAFLDKMGQPDLFPEFKHWAVHKAGLEPAIEYSLIDGGSLENLGIIPLLRRHFPLIFVCVGTPFSIGLTDPNTVDGIDHYIGRLFGFKPTNVDINNQDMQIFPSEKFAAIPQALKDARAKGEAPFYVDTYPILQPNAFEIEPYPNNGEVTIVWFHNDIYQQWYDQLPAETRTAIETNDPQYQFNGFPFYKTLGQNMDPNGTPEILYLSAEQVNLLSQMWASMVVDGAGTVLQNLSQQFA